MNRGNVIFSTDKGDAEKLIKQVEDIVKKTGMTAEGSKSGYSATGLSGAAKA